MMTSCSSRKIALVVLTCSASALVVHRPLNGVRQRFRWQTTTTTTMSSSSFEEDETNGPRVPYLYANEFPEIRWLPPLSTQTSREPTSETEVLPLFPLGVAYTPGTTEVLNIFEPRYRQMVSDILLSGGRRFAVTYANPQNEESTQLAEVGVVFYLEDLQEVSEQTNDAVKYVCTHKVLDKRILVKSVLNPEQDAARETYLKAEVATLEDDDDEEDDADLVAQLERDVVRALVEVVEMQETNYEDVRFAKGAIAKLKTAKGVGNGTLWSVIELWKNFLRVRAQATSRKIQLQVQKRLIDFLTEQQQQAGETGALPKAINLSDLPAELQQEVRNLRKRVLDDVADIVDETTNGMQRLLQARSHLDRLRLFHSVLNNEQRRLIARKSLKDALSGLGDD